MSETTHQWSSAGYLACAHSGRSKKADPRITDHDCCGKSKHNTTHAYWEWDGRKHAPQRISWCTLHPRMHPEMRWGPALTPGGRAPWAGPGYKVMAAITGR